MLKKAYVEITNRCNLACSFCPKTKREPRTMSAQEFGLVLSRLEGYVQYVYLHVMGEPLLHREGHRGGTWVLLDYGCVVVHIFNDEARKFYSLEHLWADGEEVDLSAILPHAEEK